MFRLWLADKLSMQEADSPVFPANGRSIDDVLEMYDVLTEWDDADRRATRRRDQEDGR